jgi:hypothetical protein
VPWQIRMPNAKVGAMPNPNGNPIQSSRWGNDQSKSSSNRKGITIEVRSSPGCLLN